MNRISQHLTTAAHLVDDDKQFRPGTIEAVQRFARSKPWQGTVAERAKKLGVLHCELCQIYQVKPKLVVDVPDQEGGPGSSLASYANKREVRMLRRLSVVTYLNIFSQLIGQNRRGAFRWSINLFKRCFPRSYARCRQNGTLLMRDDTN